MSITATVASIVLLAAAPAALAGENGEEVVLYTNADVEKLEPLPTGRPLVDTTFDPEAWEFVAAFIDRERAKITSDRDHELERDRVQIEAERPVGHGAAYPYYPVRVPYGRAYHGQRTGKPRPVADDAPPAAGAPHPMFQARPPVREFTPGLGDAYRRGKAD